MLIVAIESATDAAGVAIADESGTIAVRSVSRGRRHAETITPAILSCCESAGLSPRDFDAVAVDAGPGLFTGLRVGIATAKGLAYALGIPILAVDSLELLASATVSSATDSSATVSSATDSRVVPVIDARRKEVVSAQFSWRSGPDPATGGQGSDGSGTSRLSRESEDLLSTPEELAARLSATGETARGLLVGDGALRYADVLAGTGGWRIGPRWLASPPVNVLAEVGLARALRGDFDDPAAVLPRYVRQADTRINWSTRSPREGSGPPERAT